MQPSVYLETSVISYLAARPSRDVITAAHQEITRVWWGTRRGAFALFISEVVLDEIRRGDPEAAHRRAAFTQEAVVLQAGEGTRGLAEALIARTGIPAHAAADAAHVAVAALNGIDYVLTWNCRHIANAQMRRAMENTCEQAGYMAPVLCTPEELMGG